jgi:predicted metal-dependent peptidase
MDIQSQKADELPVGTSTDTALPTGKPDSAGAVTNGEAIAEKPNKHDRLMKHDPENVYQAGEFNGDFMRLYQSEPFFAGVSAEVTKIIDNRVPTAYMGVRANGKLYELILGLNAKFFRNLNEKERQGILKHELYHLIFQHVLSRSVSEESLSKLWNVATDLAINSIIGAPNLPTLALIPGIRPMDPKTKKPSTDPVADFIANAPPLQASDWYFDGLRRIQEQQGGGQGGVDIITGSGLDTIDDHDGWKDLPEDVQNEIRDKIRNLVQKNVIRADRDNSWGTVPQEIQEEIRKMVSNEVDWRSVVRNFIGRCRTTDRDSTIRKINKKLPYMFPGVKRRMVANFAAFIDQSGSMGDEDIALLFGELENLAKLTGIDVYVFDTEIDKKSHMSWKKGTRLPTVKRTRCGGTDFQSVANFCNLAENRGKWSGILVLTDGYAPKMGAINGAKVLWVITEHGTTDAVREGDLICKMKAEKTFKKHGM